MKSYLKVMIISVFMLCSLNVLAQDASKKMVKVKELTMEQAVENKRIVGELIQSKRDGKVTAEELNGVNLEIYRRGYGHHLSKQEVKAINKEIKALRVTFIEH